MGEDSRKKEEKCIHLINHNEIAKKLENRKEKAT